MKEMPDVPAGGRAEQMCHPDCDFCAERLRVNLGLLEENKQLKKRLAGESDTPLPEPERLTSKRARVAAANKLGTFIGAKPQDLLYMADLAIEGALSTLNSEEQE